MGWNFDAGPMHFGSDGVALRPQMKIGYGDNNCDVRIGVDDVRDGLSAAAAGHVKRSYEAEGTSMEQVLKDLRNQSEIKALDDIVRIAPQLLAQIVKMTGVDIPANSHVHARVIVKIGLGVGGGVCLGWADTKGFHMVGVRGSVSAAASVGADIMAGLHHTRKYVKAVLGISNLCTEVVFELPKPAPTGTAGSEQEETPIAKAAAAAANAAAAGKPAPEHVPGAGMAHLNGDEATASGVNC